MSGRWVGEVKAKLYGYNPTGSGIQGEWSPVQISSAGESAIKWNAIEDAQAPDSGVMVFGEARTTRKAAMSDNSDATRVVANEYGELVIAGYDWSSEKIDVQESSPVQDHYQGEVLANVTNGTDGTYYYYLDWASYLYGGLQFVLDGGSGSVTVTVEATLQDDGTAPASCAYEDVTNDLFGVASFTASDIAMITSPTPFKYLRVKVVASTGGVNDADWTIYARRAH